MVDVEVAFCGHRMVLLFRDKEDEDGASKPTPRVVSLSRDVLFQLLNVLANNYVEVDAVL